ncbi:MAG: DUF3786 domain-containing protein [Desulfobacteraceae bacterium]|nr:DUF3786 domain-containing protein [Desulfobacteraceae bacterium]
MARIDDYKESFRLAALDLKERNLEVLAKTAGAHIVPNGGSATLIVPFLGAKYVVKFSPEIEIVREGATADVPLTDKILIAHYLLGATGRKETGKLITFRQIPDGKFYHEAFQKRARDPFLNFFGNNGRFFVKCARLMGAVPVNNGDFGMEFAVFPQIRVQLILWHGDEEFPPDATILFDESIQKHLSAEDIAVLSGAVVYNLIGLARRVQAGEA